MKKLAILLTALAMAASLAACGSSTCKEDGCDNEVYEDGYCEYHYLLHTAQDAVSDAASGLLGSLLG